MSGGGDDKHLKPATRLVRGARYAARLGLDAARFRHQPFVRLSGGQKQKLLIARSLQAANCRR